MIKILNLGKHEKDTIYREPDHQDSQRTVSWQESIRDLPEVWKKLKLKSTKTRYKFFR